MALNQSVIASYGPERTCNHIWQRLQPYVVEAVTICHMQRSDSKRPEQTLRPRCSTSMVGVITREHTLRPRCSAGTWAAIRSR